MSTLIPDPDVDWPADLDFATEIPRLDDGGVEFIEQWIGAVDNPRLIIVDTLAKVRGSRNRNDSAYEQDYAAVERLQRLASERGVAIIMVTHTRKMGADDPIDTVSGTLGLTGAADTTLVLDRGSDGQVKLYGRGRDTPEIEQAVEFGKESCRWSILGDAGQVAKSSERERVFGALTDAPEPMSATEVASLAEMTVDNARRLLSRMMKDGEVERVGRGRYRLPSEPDPEDGSDTSDSASNTSDTVGRTAADTDPSPTCPNVRPTPEPAANCDFEPAEGRTDLGQPVRNEPNTGEGRTGPTNGSPICEPPQTADEREGRTPRTEQTGENASPKPDDGQTDIEDATAEPFAEWVERRRKAAGMTRKELAERAGAGHSTVRNALRGRFGAGPNLQAKLRAALEGDDAS